MFYEEKQDDDGLWFFRLNPEDEWELMGLIRLGNKIKELQKEIEELKRK